MRALRRGLKAILPRPLILAIKSSMAGHALSRLNAYDLARFRRRSGAVSVTTLDQQDAEITKIYHAIEKGLALPVPRPGFGAIVVVRLSGMIVERIEEKGPWTRPCANAINALTAYRDHALAHGAALPEKVDHVLALAAASGLKVDGAATQTVRREDLRAATNFDADAFFWSRHSIRQFAAEPLDLDQLLSAIDLARASPSVCNRQSSRVHVVTEESARRQVLGFQNGNRGFGDQAQAVLVITSDLNSFVHPTERYQAWIDGGMFSMALVLAIHARGLGACCLNWSSPREADEGLRRSAGIPDHETVIMLVAVGALPHTITVANSERLALKDIVRIAS